MALLCVVVLAVAPVAAADDWGRDRLSAAAVAEPAPVVDDALDPAIRGAILARSTPVRSLDVRQTPIASSGRADGFDWGAAGIGAGAGVVGLALVAASVMFFGQRHGRVRSA